MLLRDKVDGYIDLTFANGLPVLSAEMTLTKAVTGVESKIDVITIKSTEFVLDSHERSSQKLWKKNPVAEGYRSAH